MPKEKTEREKYKSSLKRINTYHLKKIQPFLTKKGIVRKRLSKEKLVILKNENKRFRLKKRIIKQRYHLITEPIKVVKRRKVKKPTEELEPEEIEMDKYFRDSLILTAYYQSEKMFDIRASIVNSTKEDTFQFLRAKLDDHWIEWLGKGKRAQGWKGDITKAIESERVDEKDIDKNKINQVVFESI